MNHTIPGTIGNADIYNTLTLNPERKIPSLDGDLASRGNEDSGDEPNTETLISDPNLGSGGKIKVVIGRGSHIATPFVWLVVLLYHRGLTVEQRITAKVGGRLLYMPGVVIINLSST